MRLSHDNCIHQSVRSVTGLACASPAPTVPLVMPRVGPQTADEWGLAQWYRR
jgi:hypothetical protein